jgi:DNA-binding response OmpR family regulator
MNRIIQNLLIIDPLWTSNGSLDESFSEHGLTIFSAGSTSDGLELIIEKKPDVVLLNFSPDGNPGFESLREIIRATPNIKVIVTGEHPDDSFGLECMRAGATDYLKGPFHMDRLIQSIRRIQNREHCVGIFHEPDIDCVISEDKTLILGNDLERIPYIVNQAVLNAKAVCSDIELLKIALGEIVLNAVEHGNLNISMKEKSEAVNNSNYQEILEKRKADPHYTSRVVVIKVHMEKDILIYHVIDEGNGFDYNREFDPDPSAHIGSGLGMQIAINFFSEVIYEGRGNMVKLVYRKC